ncbi:MAG: sugar phosphate isomerase/epimerase family protein [Anaerolineae bacterium]|jgi:sugar phosphate isomerase/epimerase|nr:TIM barrel protein [Chloroflexota bacterium]
MEQISVASYAFHGLLRQEVMDVFGYLESVKFRYGVQADIWNGMLPTTDRDYVLKVKRALDERGLVLANLCVDGAHIWEDDPDRREANYRTALAHLEAGELLGARTIRIDAGGAHDAKSFTPEQMDLIVQRYRAFAHRAEQGGYRVGPENHWGPEVVPENMVAICEAVDHPAFGVLLHLRGNAGDREIAPWAMHTHLAWEITEGPLEASMNMLRDAGYQGYWGVEHHTGENEYSEVAVQVARVRAVLDRWSQGSQVEER